MKATELRIGNYYSIAEQDGIKYKQVTYLIPSVGEWFSDGDNLTYAAKPVSLTEEWILRFGFGKTVEYDRNIFRVRKMTIVGGDRFYYSGIELTTVHQLQNLYFALTGEELTLK